jgi:hypothetical protein
MTSFHYFSIAFDRGISDEVSGASADLSQSTTAAATTRQQAKGSHLGKTKTCFHAEKWQLRFAPWVITANRQKYGIRQPLLLGNGFG